MHLKRWIAAAAATAVVFGLAAMTRASPDASGAQACGLGLPPGAPGFAEARARDAALLRTQGFVRVCPAALDRYDIALQPQERAGAGLAFTPVALGNTPFAQLHGLGGMAETVGGVKSRLYRGFRSAAGHSLILMEHDMSADGAIGSRDPADEPERINGLPARLAVMQTDAGKAVSSLTWTEGRRSYDLWIDANVATHAPLRAQLFALAAAVPVSVPACPREIVPKAPVLGPDGFPVMDAPPQFLSDARVKHMADPARPCK